MKIPLSMNKRIKTGMGDKRLKNLFSKI